MSKSNNWKTATYVLIGTLIAVTIVGSVLYATKTVGSYGTIRTSPGLNVYADAAATQTVSTIDWGSIAPDSAVNITLYLKNTSAVTQNYTYTVGNWQPPVASSFIAIQIDFLGHSINVPAGQVNPIIITLSVAPNIVGVTNFSNDITITASSG